MDEGRIVRCCCLPLLFPLSRESTLADVLEVLEPLHVADDDRAGGNEHIREHYDSVLVHYLIRFIARHSVRVLHEVLALQLLSVRCEVTERES